MTNGHLEAETFGEAATQWGEQFFRIRATQETDPDRLRAMIEAEIQRDGETRTNRIAYVNKMLEQVE